MKTIIAATAFFLLLVSFPSEASQKSEISALAASDMLSKVTGVVVLDVRTVTEYDESHLRDAIHIDAKVPGAFDRIDQLDRDATYLVYCRTFNRSTVIADHMIQAGFSQVYQMMDGITGWIGHGLPLVRNESANETINPVTMEYYIATTLNCDFDAAIEKVTEALKTEGFGIITEIDMQAKLKEKLGVDFKRYTILGACNPAFAYKALLAEEKIGIMLPCNIVVIDKGAGVTEVAAVHPVASMMAVENEALQPLAAEVTEKLKRVIGILK